MGNRELKSSNFKNIPLNMRPREKAKVKGVQNLTDQELLALILRCGTKGTSVLELSSNIINKYHNFYNLVNCEYKDLMKINGVKEAKAIEILSVMELTKRIQKSKLDIVEVINSPDDIYNNFYIFLKEEKQENFIVVFLDIKSHIINYETLFVGGSNFSLIDVNLILKKSICYGACKIICLHNHPSGDPTPSNQDIMITKKINTAAQLLEIKLLDHIIIGKDKYISLKKDGFF